MEHGKSGYWAFVEKIHDLTEYVQELLRQNGRLKRRVAELEQQQNGRDSQIDPVRRRLGDEGESPPTPAPSDQGERADSELGVWRPRLRVAHPGVRTCP